MRRRILSVVFVLHVLALAVWCLPPNPLWNWAFRPAGYYLSPIGLQQSWALFAPDPQVINFDVVADIRYKDGTNAQYTMVRVNELPFPQRLMYERIRKWRSYVRMDEYRSLWPEACLWLARKHWTDPQNPPVQITLIRNYMYVEPPTQDYVPRPARYEYTRRDVLCSYLLTERDLVR